VLNACNGQDALEIFNRRAPDLVLVDIMMPEMDGYTICKRIREVSTVPVIMITETELHKDDVDLGANGYITKLFSSRELVNRIKAVMRAARKNKPKATSFKYEGLRIDFHYNLVFKDGDYLQLSNTEYRLLSCLARNAGRLLPAE